MAFEGVAQRIMRNPPANSFREGNYLHVSDLVYKCTRMIALSKELQQPIRGESIMDSRGVTFATGHAIQAYVTERMKTNFGDMLWGDWTCGCGEGLYRHTLYSELPTTTCESCGGKYEYLETIWRSESLKLTGAIDIVLKLPSGHLYPIEVKSMAGSRWDDLTRPVPDHLIQALFYWHLLVENDMPVIDQLSLLYVKKEFVFGNPYKELIVVPSNYENRMTDFYDEARELKAYREDDGPLPVRTVCSHPQSPGARECPFALQCFAIDPPPGDDE